MGDASAQGAAPAAEKVYPMGADGRPAYTWKDFVHLHVHSQYSILDGGCHTKRIPDRLAELGMDTIGLSDHGTMGGLLNFELAMRDKDIRPVLGCEIYLTEDRHHRGKHEDDDRKYWHLGLIAKNTEGYFNMCTITSRGSIEGFYSKPRVDWEILAGTPEGIIALTGCMASPVMNAIFNGDLQASKGYVQRLVDIFGLENVYGEIQNVGIIRTIPHDSEIARMLDLEVVETHDSDTGELIRVCELSQNQANRLLVDEICKPMGMRYIATGDAHYLREEDAIPHDALVCVSQNKKTLLDEKRFSLLPKKYHLRSADEVIELMSEWPEALAETRHLADRCDATIPIERPMLPRFPDKPDEFWLNLQYKPPHKPGNAEPDVDVEPFAITDAEGNQLWDEYEKRDLEVPKEIYWELKHEGVQYTDRIGNLRPGIDVKEMQDAARRQHLFRIVDQAASRSYLRHLCEAGMTLRYGEDWESVPERRERLEFEMNTVDWMGYNDYFLITWDFYAEAKRRGIAAGPGRGSGAGSIMLYSLEVTQIDPLEYDLLFERFLNPDRISMPDVDCDFSIHRRGELIQYVAEKYNKLADCETAVAQIITYGVIRAKQALKDACRVLGYEATLGGKITKTIQSKNPKVSIEEALEENPDFKSLCARDQDVRKIVELARWLEGFNRNESIHAAGVVIWDRPLESIMPLQRKGAGKELTTAFEMTYVEMVGALKMDFLGLRNLDIIERTCEIVKHTEGIDLDPYALDLTDAGTYEMLSNGDSVGCFQVESTGMQGSLRMIKPTVLRDLIALVALYRPGPMRNIPVYAARKQGREELVMDHPLLDDIYGETQGLAIYQEQLMRVSQVLGGFTRGEADVMRKAIGKKNLYVMEGLRDKFFDGCEGNGVPRKTAQLLWERDFLPAADYSFNKCLAPSSRLVLDSGETISIVEAFAQQEAPMRLMSMWSDGRVAPHSVHRIVKTDRKQMLRIELDNGASIICSADHRLLTGHGYQEASLLRIGESMVLTSEDAAAPELVPVAAAAPQRARLLPGMAYQKQAVQLMHDWLTEHAQLFHHRTVAPSGGYADFMYKGVYWAIDTMDRSSAWYSRRYGDAPYRVVAPEEIRFVLPQFASESYASHAGSTVVSITDAGMQDSYDVEMQLGGPRNFLVGDAASAGAPALVSHNSHAACYGLLAYITAYLKHNHPHAYMASLLSAVMATKDKVPFYLQETRRMGLPVMPPDVNRSLNEFSVMPLAPSTPRPDPEHSIPGADKYEILVGLRALKQVGAPLIADIKRERESERGPFTSFHDFVRRMPTVNKTSLKQLIRGGALDGLGMTRKGMFDGAEDILEERKKWNSRRERAYAADAVEKFTAAYGDDPAWQGARGLRAPVKRSVEAAAKLQFKYKELPSAEEITEKSGKAFMSEAQALIKRELKKTEMVAQAADQYMETELEKTAEERAEHVSQLAAQLIVLLPTLPARDEHKDQDDMLQEMEEALGELDEQEWGWSEKLQHEYDVLGIYASGHPLDVYRTEWSRYISLPLADVNHHYLNQWALFCGVVTEKAFQTFGFKKKPLYKFMIDDLSGSKEIAFFMDLSPELYEAIEPGTLVSVEAQVREDTFTRDQEEAEAGEDVAVKLTGRSIALWQPGRVHKGPVTIRVPHLYSKDSERLSRIDQILRMNEGEHEVALERLDPSDQPISGSRVTYPQGVRLTPQLMHLLRRQLEWQTPDGKRRSGRRYVL